MSTAKRDAYETITARIIERLEAGAVPWRKPWTTTVGPQRNAISSRPYRGINVLVTALADYSDPRWLTFNQARERGGHVRKGEHGTPILFWRFVERDDAESPTGTRRIPLARIFTVFNVAQCDGLDLPALEPERPDFDAIAAAEAIVEGMPQRPRIAHDGHDRAYYRAATDSIHLPERSTFESAHAYYATAFHELTHSTGHASRLNRHGLETGIAAFGSPCYSREELAAEMGSAFLCAEAGIVADRLEQHAAYVQAWIDAMRADSKLVIVAAGQGQRAADFILNRRPEADA